jgi:SRSO17 transposase
LDNITLPVLFGIFMLENGLNPGDTYRSKPTPAGEMVQELRARAFQFDRVLADR